MIGSLISAGTNLLGGFLNRSATEKANQQRVALAQQQMDEQRHYATHGIRMRVKDAQKAGIHPLFALGASTSSYTPQTVGVEAETGIGDSMVRMGQDLSRAFNSTRTLPERDVAFNDAIRSFQLKNLELDTEIKKATLASAVQRLNQNANPPLPISESKTSDPRPLGFVGGNKIATDDQTSNVDDFWTKRYGEPGEWLGAAAVGWQDIKRNLGNMSFLEMLKALDRRTRIW